MPSLQELNSLQLRCVCNCSAGSHLNGLKKMKAGRWRHAGHSAQSWAQPDGGCAWAARQAAGTYLWGGLARVDVLAAPLATELVFYGSEVPDAAPWLHALQRVRQHALQSARTIFYLLL